MAEGNDSVVKLKSIIDKIQEEARKNATKFMEMTHGKSDELADTATMITLFAALIALEMGFGISFGIFSPISRAVRFAEEISNGNFTEAIDIERKDEVGILASAVSRIDEISGVIKGIDDILRTIASAIEEQSSATNEIATNIAHASTGIQDVNENVNKSSQMAATIPEEIALVSSQTQEVSTSSSEVSLSAILSGRPGLLGSQFDDPQVKEDGADDRCPL